MGPDHRATDYLAAAVTAFTLTIEDPSSDGILNDVLDEAMDEDPAVVRQMLVDAVSWCWSMCERVRELDPNVTDTHALVRSLRAASIEADIDYALAEPECWCPCHRSTVHPGQHAARNEAGDLVDGESVPCPLCTPVSSVPDHVPEGW